MKKTLIALTLAAIIPAAAYAAGDTRGHHSRGPHVERLAERLELSEEQQAKVRALFEEQREQHMALREQMREQMHGKMAEVLTPEQLAKMEAMRAEHKEKRKEKRAHRMDRDCGEDRGAKSS